jgi:hypothetical protein
MSSGLKSMYGTCVDDPAQQVCAGREVVNYNNCSFFVHFVPNRIIRIETNSAEFVEFA